MKLNNNIIFFLILFNFYNLNFSKVALITGITGQDGSYLAELLIEKGYEVHGLIRRSSSPNTSRIDNLIKSSSNRLFLHYGELTDSSSMTNLIKKVNPDEIYNLAAQSFVWASFEVPEFTAMVDGIATLIILDAIKSLNLINKTKFYQASTSEMFGKVQEIPQKETTPFYPRSPYGAAKLYAHWITINYREAYNIFACSGILFNHESPRRGLEFVTRKITNTIAKIKFGLEDKLVLGNLDAKRDWGYAKDYVEAMWLILQQDHPEDYVIATGQTRSVREFIELAFNHVGIKINWQGKDVNEVGLDSKTGKVLVSIDSKYFRPTEVDLLIGDPTKAEKNLGWKSKTSLEELVKLMVENDLQNIEKEVNASKDKITPRAS